MAAKKRRVKIPPRQVWCVVTDASDGAPALYPHVFPLRGIAKEIADQHDGWRVVGPYVLAELVREK